MNKRERSQPKNKKNKKSKNKQQNTRRTCREEEEVMTPKARRAFVGACQKKFQQMN